MTKLDVPIITMQEFHTKLKANGVDRMTAVPVVIIAVSEEVINGEPVLVIYHATEEGERFGAIMDKFYAAELTEALGPHPLVEKYFREH